jgi:hypothetical protein
MPLLTCSKYSFALTLYLYGSVVYIPWRERERERERGVTRLAWKTELSFMKLHNIVLHLSSMLLSPSKYSLFFGSGGLNLPNLMNCACKKVVMDGWSWRLERWCMHAMQRTVDNKGDDDVRQ